MVRRLKPADWQTKQFHAAGLSWHRAGGVRLPGGPLQEGDGPWRPSCWLWSLDPEERPCEGRLEVMHVLGRQRIRNALFAQLRDLPKAERDELICLAEWDPRNAAPGCTGHHRPYDNHMATGLKIPAEAVPLHTLYFALHWGLEHELQDKCEGNLALVIEERIGVPDRRYS